MPRGNLTIVTMSYALSASANMHPRQRPPGSPGVWWLLVDLCASQRHLRGSMRVMAP
uniref:Uncharacterized protein n=1 Tax=Arundo donax TaxID=35708 RepID=A0A0A9GD00_ARUDO